MSISVTTNLDRVIVQLDKIPQDIAELRREFLYKLGEIGISAAEVNFSRAVYDGVNDVQVSRTPYWVNDRTIAISARGNAVVFIEFGTGVIYPQTHPNASVVPPRGSYGRRQGATGRYWVYRGEPGTNGLPVNDRQGNPKDGLWKTKGNPSNRAMYDAGQQVRGSILRIAKEVFGS